MMKKHMILALAALATAPTLVSAQSTSIRESYTLPVAQIDANSFEVVEADGAGGTQMWCAAGIYARKVLGERGGDIYIESARGPSQTMPGRKAVVFTTAPVDGAFSSTSLGIRTVGATHSMTHAFALCREMKNLRIRTGPNQLVRS